MYDGVRGALDRFAQGARDVIEVGCGTGHWLTELLALGVPTVLGIDRSAGMLDRAAHAAAGAYLMQGSAEGLPLRAESVDRVVCINALHHFPNPSRFLSECRRVLRSGGGVMTIGLDPHQGNDQWPVRRCGHSNAFSGLAAGHLIAGNWRGRAHLAGYPKLFPPTADEASVSRSREP